MAVMGNVQKKKHIFYNLNWKKKRSGKKYKNAINRYISLLKRKETEGDTKWIQQTIPRAEARLDKYGISPVQIKDALEQKGLEKLFGSVTYKNV